MFHLCFARDHKVISLILGWKSWLIISLLFRLLLHYWIDITWFYITYFINYLKVPKTSTELVIWVPYFFLHIWSLGNRGRKIQHKLVVSNSVNSLPHTAFPNIGVASGKPWSSARSLNSVPFSLLLDFALAVFSCKFCHCDETAIRSPSKRGFLFPAVLIKLLIEFNLTHMLYSKVITVARECSDPIS